MHRLMLLARIDARRPAGWLALAVAAGAAGILPEAPVAGFPAPAVVATLLGAVAAVMALGDAGHGGWLPGIDAGWLAERAAWPLAGWVVAAGLRGCGPILVCGGLGILGATILFAALRRRGATAADAASCTLAVAGGGAAAGWWADGVWSTRQPGSIVAASALGLVALGVGIAIRPSLPGGVGLRRLLTAAGMIGAVAGMVGWLFLAADRAAFDLAASLAWFAALAVPAATLGDGVSHATVWRRLEKTMPRVAGGWLKPPPGRSRDALLATLTTATVLGWPPLVAAALRGLARSGPALAVAMALGAVACALLLVVWLGERAGARPATVQAVALACACLIATGIVAVWSSGPDGPPGLSGIPPVNGPIWR